jgi:hypothetical protein
MKKAIAIFAIAALVACGGSASTEVKADEATTVDTAAASQNDTSDYKKINEERKAELEQVK